MEIDAPMMEIGYVFGKTLDAAKSKKTLTDDARALGARWLRGRIESSTVLRWNSVRKDALAQTEKIAQYAIENSAKPAITAEELAAAIRYFSGRLSGMFMEECPF